MAKFSANLGFLFTELSLPAAIRAAKVAGFQAVECHRPYDTDPEGVRSALIETGLPMLGLNTRSGDLEAGENGVAALAGREDEARGYIDEAIDYAVRIDCSNIHVLAGFTDGGAEAEKVFQSNLRYATSKAARHGKTILIEPLNHYDAPGYHLKTTDAALATISAVGASNLKLMFDCYHVQIMQGDLTRHFREAQEFVGHIQIAAVPDRGEPDDGEINYPFLLDAIDQMGWSGYIGAEYRPRNGTATGLGWLQSY